MGRKPDPLTVQISAEVANVGVPVTRDLLRAAVAYRLDHDVDPPGITLRIVEWRNPTRLRAEDRAPRSGNQSDAWATLGNALRASVESDELEFSVGDLAIPKPKKRRKITPKKRVRETWSQIQKRAFSRRSRAAKKGWITRRKNAAAIGSKRARKVAPKKRGGGSKRARKVAPKKRARKAIAARRRNRRRKGRAKK